MTVWLDTKLPACKPGTSKLSVCRTLPGCSRLAIVLSCEENCARGSFDGNDGGNSKKQRVQQVVDNSVVDNSATTDTAVEEDLLEAAAATTEQESDADLEVRRPVAVKEAKDSELDFLLVDTLEVVPRPSGLPVIGSRWVVTEKRDGRVKARSAAREFRERGAGTDYSLSSATPSKSALKAVLALTSVRMQRGASSETQVVTMDVEKAFLNAAINEDGVDREVFVEIPPDVAEDRGLQGFVFRCRRALYGLRASPKLWQIRFHRALEELGMKACQSDCNVMHCQGSDGLLVLMLHVDDVIMAGSPAAVGPCDVHSGKCLS